MEIAIPILSEVYTFIQTYLTPLMTIVCVLSWTIVIAIGSDGLVVILVMLVIQVMPYSNTGIADKTGKAGNAGNIIVILVLLVMLVKKGNAGNILIMLVRQDITIAEAKNNTITILGTSSISSLIQQRQLNFLHSFSRLPDDSLPRLVLEKRLSCSTMKGSLPVFTSLLVSLDLPYIPDILGGDWCKHAWSRSEYCRIVRKKGISES